MIPDFPVEKEKIMQALMLRHERKHAEYLGFFSEIPAYSHHEGNRWAIKRADGSESEEEYRDIRTEFKVKFDDIPKMTPADLISRIDALAEETARQMHGVIMEEITAATDEAGRSIDARGRPLDQELFLKGMDSIDLDFDSNGKLKPPAIIMHPKLWEARKDEIKSWESDPEFAKQYEALMARKKDEWRARENRRKLVD